MSILKELNDFIKSRKWTILSIIIVASVGILCNFYTGFLSFWVRNSFGGVLYEIFWCLIILFFFSKMQPIFIVTLTFIVTCILEFLQLIHTPCLEFFRGFIIGRLILGTSFSLLDIPYYFIGCTISYFWIKFLVKTETTV